MIFGPSLSSPKIMGVMNVTPDSFSDGGAFEGTEAAVAHGMRLMGEGADILDIGGESTRPGADFVPVDEEISRVIPVIEGLRQPTDLPLSIDTRKPEEARAAVEAGASIWNDVSALAFSPDSPDVAAELGCAVVLMHAQGDPKTMQDAPRYANVVEEVAQFLSARLEACVAAGVAREKIAIDPGIGFGKTLEHNLALLGDLERFTEIAPVLLGVSRKRFIAAIDNAANGAEPGPQHRLAGSLAAVLTARGASILRVHDVAATRQALAVAAAIKSTAARPIASCN